MIAKVDIYISQLIPKSHFLYRVPETCRLSVSFPDTAQTPFPQFLTNTVLSLSTFLLLSSTAECQGVPCRGELAHFSLSLFLFYPSLWSPPWLTPLLFLLLPVLCLYPSLLFFCCNSLYPLWLHFSSAIFVFFLSFFCAWLLLLLLSLFRSHSLMFTFTCTSSENSLSLFTHSCSLKLYAELKREREKQSTTRFHLVWPLF